jgi:hypothetical protein
MRKTLFTMAALCALVAAACGGGESLAENLTERAIEGAGGGNVDVEFDEDGEDFEVNVQTDEGSITIGGGEIPDGLDVPVPDGGDVQSSMALNDDITVSVAWSGSEYERLVSFYEDWTGAQDMEFEKNSSTFESDDGVLRNTSWYSSDRNTIISVGDCYSIESGELDDVCVNISRSN